MQLCELIKELPYLVETRGDMSVEIASVTSNSREKVVLPHPRRAL